MRRPLSLALLALYSTALVACSDGDDDDSGSAATAPATADGGTAAARPATTPGTIDPGATAPSVSPIPETGVPGLDSPDAFCVAWSQFAGSFQVVAVASSFLTDRPERAFELEVAASPVVAGAYGQMQQAWPAELEAERDAALGGRFGPFADRAATALDFLRAAVPDAARLNDVVGAWLDALATRDPSTPDVQLTLPADLSDAVAAAAAAFSDDVPPVASDPALVTDAETPLTDQYLATTCPDQGTLSGTEGE